MVNDVSGGLADPAMARVVADAGVPWVLMHRRGDSRDMYAEATYDDVVADVRRELCATRRRGAGRGRGGRADRRRPRSRLRQAAGTRSGPAGRPGPHHRARLPRPGRRLPQALPRRPARGAGRTAPATGPAGQRHPRHHRCSPHARAHGACACTTWRAARTRSGWSPPSPREPGCPSRTQRRCPA